MLFHIFKLNLINFCQIHEQISLATYNYECYVLVHVHVFLRAAAFGFGYDALNVQIRMEDGMDESKYKASFDGQLGAGTAGPGANFA